MTGAFATVAVLLATTATASTAFADDKCDTQVAKGVSLKGSFAYDRGCMFEAVIVRGKKYADVESATPKAMVQLGWNKKDAKREDIAMAWITDVLAAWGEYRVKWSTDDDDSDDFKHKFYEPKTTTKDGAVTIKYWRDETRIGMRMPDSRDFVETVVTIDAKGKLTVTDKSTFEEPWK
jgi:hypothetical protein